MSGCALSARHHVLKHPRQIGKQNGGRGRRLLPPGHQACAVSTGGTTLRHGSEVAVAWTFRKPTVRWAGPPPHEGACKAGIAWRRTVGRSMDLDPGDAERASFSAERLKAQAAVMHVSSRCGFRTAEADSDACLLGYRLSEPPGTRGSGALPRSESST
jgi:hypothetical protein